MARNCSASAWLAIASMLIGLAVAAVPARSQSGDDEIYGGLPEGKGRDTVLGYCAACHSLRLVSQQRLPQYRWEELLIVMNEKHGMPKLPPEDKEVILDYLAKQLGPPARRRKF